MNNIKYLICDAEMGGRDIHYSLLTAYFMVTNSEFNVLGDLYLPVKPDGDYVVSGQGMEVNKINLQEHDKIAITYKQAKPELFNFLKHMSNGVRLIPVGHGIRGDISHFQKYLISEGSWEQFCTYHYIDTSVVLQYLRAIGKMPEDGDGSIIALANYFNVKIEGKDHDCRVDVLKTMGVFQKMVELGNK